MILMSSSVNSISSSLLIVLLIVFFSLKNEFLFEFNFDFPCDGDIDIISSLLPKSLPLSGLPTYHDRSFNSVFWVGGNLTVDDPEV